MGEDTNDNGEGSGDDGTERTPSNQFDVNLPQNQQCL